uniref:Immunoglobulin superfamily DCC subclass member 3 n=1 Tax=Naja naja TaxID=35670 RepID=A0A8C6VL27_NAJNA
MLFLYSTAPKGIVSQCLFFLFSPSLLPYIKGLLLFSFIPDFGFSTELAFTVEPSDQIAVQEQPLVLDCQVEGIQPISITWRKNGMLVAEGEDLLTLANGDSTSDEGEYGCVREKDVTTSISSLQHSPFISSKEAPHPFCTTQVTLRTQISHQMLQGPPKRMQMTSCLQGV